MTARVQILAKERGVKLVGADVERLVLARAVQAHCQDRVLRHGATTVVF